MKNVLSVILSGGLIITSAISLTGCSPIDSNQLQSNKVLLDDYQSLGNKNKIEKPSYKELNYSNMVDKKTQEEIKEILIKNNIDKEDVQKYFKALNNYNKMYEGNLPNTSEFSILDKSQVPYDELAFQSKWMEKNDEYIDANCRVSAFRLMNKLIESKGDFKGDYSQIGMDIDTMINNPYAKFDKFDIEKFKAVFAPIKIEKFGTDEEVAKIINEEWTKRGISFKDSKTVTLISGFTRDEDLKETIDGHVGVAIQNGDEVLFIEKYSPAMPYQITKFKNKEEVRSYMFDRLISTEGDVALPRPIIMENNKLMK